MKKPRALLMVDQATRDSLGQLLLAHYLRRKGVTPLLCNQATLVSTFEHYRPEVAFVSWTTDANLGQYFRSIRHRTRLVLVDQEGGRMGEAAFKRSIVRHDGAKAGLARSAARVIAWGSSQAQWLRELDVTSPDRIVVTGCPRLDPYLVAPATAKSRQYIGVTLRGDPITAMPFRFMETVFNALLVDPRDGLTPSLPLRAEYEDWVWQIVAVTRHMFKLIMALSNATDTSIVVRPGPWEQEGVYDYLPRRFPRVSIEPRMLQHEYVSGAYVTLDASSSLGLEALLAGTPVISINSLIPRLEEHVGGTDGARFNAPYRTFYWQPKSVDDAVELVLQAQRGDLGLTPDPEGVKRYLSDCHSWPAHRPASFNIGDVLLELIDAPQQIPRDADARNPVSSLKQAVYRIPGMPPVVAAAHLTRLWGLSGDRQLHRRYHYFHRLYRHHAEVRRIFEALWMTYERGASSGIPTC
ncbi:MAG: hypothetical protein HY216_14770 [Candidatus Rokubacteria bacterium]|nr:hypothetical protein [Candidatus Rokubacteria bacterium]